MYFQAINRPAMALGQGIQVQPASQVRFSGTPVRIQNVSEAADKLQWLLNDKRNEAAARYQETMDAEGQQLMDKLVSQGTPEGKARFIADIGPNSIFNGIRMQKFFQEEFSHFDSLRQVVQELESKADKTPVETQAILLGQFILTNETAHYTDVDPVTNCLSDGSNPGTRYNHFVFRDEVPHSQASKVKSPHVNFSELARIARNNELDAQSVDAYNRSANATLTANLPD